jgi:release factor glutamine methyltransferase
MMMEIGYTQSPLLEELLKSWSEVHFVPDLQGIPRVAVGRKT